MEKEKWLYLKDVNPKRKRIFLTNKGKDIAFNTVQKVIDIESKIFENYDEEKINITDHLIQKSSEISLVSAF